MNDVVTIEQMNAFLEKVDKLFPVPLSEKCSLSVLATKLLFRGTILTISENNSILSMVAGYTKEVIDQKAYISVVATLPDSSGKGYAKTLVREFINIAKNNALVAVHLYTHQSNYKALSMYEGIGFTKWVVSNEPRPNDIHLIYWTDEKSRNRS